MPGTIRAGGELMRLPTVATRHDDDNDLALVAGSADRGPSHFATERPWGSSETSASASKSLGQVSER